MGACIRGRGRRSEWDRRPDRSATRRDRARLEHPRTSDPIPVGARPEVAASRADDDGRVSRDAPTARTAVRGTSRGRSRPVGAGRYPRGAPCRSGASDHRRADGLDGPLRDLVGGTASLGGGLGGSPAWRGRVAGRVPWVCRDADVGGGLRRRAGLRHCGRVQVCAMGRRQLLPPGAVGLRPASGLHGLVQRFREPLGGARGTGGRLRASGGGQVRRQHVRPHESLSSQSGHRLVRQPRPHARALSGALARTDRTVDAGPRGPRCLDAEAGGSTRRVRRGSFAARLDVGLAAAQGGDLHRRPR